MKRSVFAAVLVLAGCNMEHDTPVPPPPPSASAAEATAPAPSTAAATTTTAAPTPHAPTTPTTTPVPAGPPAHVTPPEATHVESAVCQSAFRCCEAAVAAMPIGGLIAGCSELRNADESRASYCREAITTYRSALTQIGAPIPAACHAPH